MKNKKILLILFLTLFLTGCTATYNVNINNDYVKEELNINNYDSFTWNNKIANTTYKEMINSAYSNAIPVLYNTPGIFEYNLEMEGYNYYSKSLIKTSNNLGMRMNYTFSFDDYKDSTLVNNFYRYFTIKEQDNDIIINAYGDNGIFEEYEMLDEVAINITIPLSVSYNNADSVSGNTYTWILTEDNVYSKQISLKYSKKENKVNTTDNKDNNIQNKDETKEENKEQVILQTKEEKKPVKYYLMVAGLVFLIGFMISLIFIYKFKKNNGI